jgi:hypothetical protein
MHAAAEDKPGSTLMRDCMHCSLERLLSQIIVLRVNTSSRRLTVSVQTKRLQCVAAL